jgi:hypothetical protein
MPEETPEPFRYETYPQGEGFSMRPAARDAITEGAFLDEWAALAGGTRAQAETWLRAFLQLMVKYARQSRPVDFLLRLARMQPTGGGKYPIPNPAAVDVRKHIGFNLILHRDVERDVETDCPVESAGTTGGRKPSIDSVLGRPGNLPDRYSTTAGMLVYGSEFRDTGEAAPEPAAFLENTDGSSPLSVAVIESAPTKLTLGPVPAGTTGQKRLRIIAGYSSGAFDIYTKVLSPL